MLDDPLVEAVRRIVERFKPKLIILFGSRARGDWVPGSDYDLLIIGDFTEKLLDRIDKVLEAIEDLPIPMEPHPYTVEEAEKMLLKGNVLIIDALEEGKPLYIGSPSVYKRLLSLLEMLKKRGLRRSNTSIILPE